MPGRRVRMGVWGLLCASLAAAAVLSAGAQPVPDEPPGVRIDRAFQQHRIGDRPLGARMGDLDAQGCLLDPTAPADEQPEVTFLLRLHF